MLAKARIFLSGTEVLGNRGGRSPWLGLDILDTNSRAVAFYHRHGWHPTISRLVAPEVPRCVVGGDGPASPGGHYLDCGFSQRCWLVAPIHVAGQPKTAAVRNWRGGRIRWIGLLMRTVGR